MPTFKRNIWALFAVLVTVGILFMLFVTWHTWGMIQEDYRKQLNNQVTLVYNAVHSQFLHQEMLLDILGKELLENGSTLKAQTTAPKIYNHLIDMNPDFAGLGLLTPAGDYIYISGTGDVSRLPNLISQEASRDTFLHTLEEKKMVLGRTYFYPPFNEWVIPIRKALRDSEGRVVAVIAAALRVEKTASQFANSINFGDYNSIQIIRDYDNYLQFSSDTTRPREEIYTTRVSGNIVYNTLLHLSREKGLPIDEIKQTSQLYHLHYHTNSGEKFFYSLRYNPRYEIWIVSAISHRQLYREFFSHTTIYYIIFFTTVVLLFLLFKIIHTAEAKRRADLERQANFDYLTGLPNRNYLRKNIENWIYEKAPSFSVIYIDMDYFKNVNDSFGHQFGDRVLIELSARLRRFGNSRSLIVRHGGDEFVLFDTETDEEKILERCGTLMTEISKPYEVDSFTFNLGASMGIARYPDHGDSLDSILRSVDIALYESKKDRNTISVFQNTMEEVYLNHIRIEQQLRHAEEYDELFVVYQPQVMHDGTLCGVESLLRWNNPNLGQVPPDKFISIAEASGIMPSLGDFILKQSLREIGEVHEESGIPFTLSINISVKQFMQKSFSENLLKAIETSKLEYENITLEITENIFIEDLDYIIPILTELHDAGIRISMDDFGTGYSSLNVLRLLPIDELKIDKSFVQGIGENRDSEKMIRNIISIGKNLGLKILAEGVENSDELEILTSYGCDYFQGYYFAKPMRNDELKKFLQKE